MSELNPTPAQAAGFWQGLRIAKRLSLPIYLFLLPLVYLQPSLALVHGRLYFYPAQCMQGPVSF